MNEKLIVQMSIQEGDHEFVFLMPYGAPIGSAYNAAHSMLVKITEMAKDSAEKAKPIEPEVQ